MPTWAVTGRLGSGKTLYAVKMVFDVLAEGRPVAANIDLFPEKVFPPWYDQSNVRVTRTPDQPTRADLDALGHGNPTNDETKNGLLILDECATLLNARSYRDDTRASLVEWFLHSRKMGWDIAFVVQSVSMIDKQIRDALIEYKVVCRRLDRFNVPLLSAVGIKIKMPRIHFAIVRYGTEANAPIAERAFFRGTNLFKAYNTKQLLFGMVEANYSCLSPFHLVGRYMKLSTVVLRSMRSALAGGLILGAAISYLVLVFGFKYTKQISSAKQQDIEVAGVISAAITSPDGGTRVLDKDGRIHEVQKVIETPSGVFFQLKDGKRYRLENK